MLRAVTRVFLLPRSVKLSSGGSGGKKVLKGKLRSSSLPRRSGKRGLSGSRRRSGGSKERRAPPPSSLSSKESSIASGKSISDVSSGARESADTGASSRGGGGKSDRLDAPSHLAPIQHGSTHVDPNTNLPRMVDISEKQRTFRLATAVATLIVPATANTMLEDMKQTLTTKAHRRINTASSNVADGDEDEENERDSSKGTNEPVAFMEEFYTSKKGPLFATAVIAGTNAVKQCSTLIPFCHTLPIQKCSFTFRRRAIGPAQRSSSLPHRVVLRKGHASPAAAAVAAGATPSQVRYNRLPVERSMLYCFCTVATDENKTGVEMEALTGATVASLTLYDMLKGLPHAQEDGLGIGECFVLAKRGGKADFTKLLISEAELTPDESSSITRLEANQAGSAEPAAAENDQRLPDEDGQGDGARGANDAGSSARSQRESQSTPNDHRGQEEEYVDGGEGEESLQATGEELEKESAWWVSSKHERRQQIEHPRRRYEDGSKLAQTVKAPGKKEAPVEKNNAKEERKQPKTIDTKKAAQAARSEAVEEEEEEEEEISGEVDKKDSAGGDDVAAGVRGKRQRGSVAEAKGAKSQRRAAPSTKGQATKKGDDADGDDVNDGDDENDEEDEEAHEVDGNSEEDDDEFYKDLPVKQKDKKNAGKAVSNNRKVKGKSGGKNAPEEVEDDEDSLEEDAEEEDVEDEDEVEAAAPNRKGAKRGSDKKNEVAKKPPAKQTTKQTRRSASAEEEADEEDDVESASPARTRRAAAAPSKSNGGRKSRDVEEEDEDEEEDGHNAGDEEDDEEEEDLPPPRKQQQQQHQQQQQRRPPPKSPVPSLKQRLKLKSQTRK